MSYRSVLIALMALTTAFVSELTLAQDTSGTTQKADQSTRGDPVAVVKSVSRPEAVGVRFMDYLYENQQLDLGDHAKLTLLYLNSCRAETIRGGTIEVGATRSRSKNAEVSHETVECSQAETVTTVQARRAGAAVVRDSERLKPGSSKNPQKARTAQANKSKSRNYDANATKPYEASETHWYIRGLHPIMKWPQNELTAPFTVELTTFSTTPTRLIWQKKTNLTHLRYPEEAPKLKIDTSYRVRVVDANNQTATAIFVSEQKDGSSDESLEALVPLRR